MAHGPTLQTETCIPTPGIYGVEVVSYRQDLSSTVSRGVHCTPHHPFRSTTEQYTALHTINSGVPQGSKLHSTSFTREYQRAVNCTPHHPLGSTTGQYTALHTIHSGVPQDSILGPILFSLYTADLPETEHTMTATYADDTTILASHQNYITASIILQRHIHQLEKWLKRWRIWPMKINQPTLPSP